MKNFLFSFSIILVACLASCSDDMPMDNSTQDILIKEAECMNPEEHEEIFILQEIPVKILNFSQEEFEDEVGNQVLSFTENNTSYEIRINIFYPINGSSCFYQLHSSSEIDSQLFDELKSLFDENLEFEPGRINQNEEVDALGQSSISVINGQVDTIVHKNYNF